MSSPKIGVFWPGDYRSKPNDLAQRNAEEATVQLERALKKLGRKSYRIEGFLTRPHEAIEKLGPVDDPCRWCLSELSSTAFSAPTGGFCRARSLLCELNEREEGVIYCLLIWEYFRHLWFEYNNVG